MGDIFERATFCRSGNLARRHFVARHFVARHFVAKVMAATFCRATSCRGTTFSRSFFISLKFTQKQCDLSYKGDHCNVGKLLKTLHPGDIRTRDLLFRWQR
jgi:hypothetical protein